MEKYCVNAYGWLIALHLNLESKTYFNYYYELLGPILENSLTQYPDFPQDSNLRLNVRSARYVEALISDSYYAGFRNFENIKPGHRNIYINGGELKKFLIREEDLSQRTKMSRQSSYVE